MVQVSGKAVLWGVQHSRPDLVNRLGFRKFWFPIWLAQAATKLLLLRRNPTNPPLRPRLQVRLQHVQEIDTVLLAAHDLGNRLQL